MPEFKGQELPEKQVEKETARILTYVREAQHVSQCHERSVCGA